MTAQEYAKKVRQQVEELKKNNRPLKIAAASAHAMMARRIFVDGQDKTNNPIGQYSEEDLWVNPTDSWVRNQKGLSPLTGKADNVEFKSNPDRKRATKYFKGWKGFREAQGLPTANVNLNYTGEMFFDFSRPVQFINPKEYVSSFNKELSAKKAEGNSAHFRKVIFSLSDKEKKEFFRVANLELKLIFES